MNKKKGTPISRTGMPYIQLYDERSQRLYINEDERLRFLHAAEKAPGVDCTLAMTLLYTGCRISEALALTVDSVQLKPGLVTIRTLKKRGPRVHIRQVPIPPGLAYLLQCHHPFHAINAQGRANQVLLWPISRSTAWRRISNLMDAAGIVGVQATPKGLRHGFGVHCVLRGVQLNMLQKWMGHASIGVTAGYANASGPEEFAVCARTWD
ncbi:site-specific integrase [Oricola sp.]|uniref:tyrosine-type recombinase/integrase n=1 Tax=Oricola sp. TaxID=1979950 RepID=UPI0025F9321A|nr:site-specific integrase [Oricola sp.]MCI5076857.1 site-specific integrase [Oricola sp.]